MKKRTLLEFFTFYTLLIFILMGTLGCQDLAKENDGNSGLTASQVPDKKSRVWPKPTSYIGQIPVYQKFDDIAPIFNFKNDTTYVINFWATWCKPCIEELPYFEALNKNHKGKKVKVILVSLDFPKKLETQLLPFIQENGLESTVMVLLDGKYNNWIDKVSTEWSGAIPATYLYHKDRNHFIAEPVSNDQTLEEAIKTFL